jgi:hypothetical protein
LGDLPRAFQTKADNSISVRRFDIRRSSTCAVSERDGARNTAHGLALVGMARDLAPADLNAYLGKEVRKLYSDMLREEIPDEMAELLKQLDQLKEASLRGQNADDP